MQYIMYIQYVKYALKRGWLTIQDIACAFVVRQ